MIAKSLAVLTCNVTGYPPPIITWMPLLRDRASIRGVNGVFNQTTGLRFVVSNLTISPVLREDGGVYTCIASNTMEVSGVFSLVLKCEFQ